MTNTKTATAYAGFKAFRDHIKLVSMSCAEDYFEFNEFGHSFRVEAIVEINGKSFPAAFLATSEEFQGGDALCYSNLTFLHGKPDFHGRTARTKANLASYEKLEEAAHIAGDVCPDSPWRTDYLN